MGRFYVYAIIFYCMTPKHCCGTITVNIFPAAFYRFLLALAVIFSSTTSAAAAQNIALVVGAESYRDYGLRTPVNNANAVAQKLKNLNFDVKISANATHYELRDDIQAFGARASRAAMSVLFYSGHTIKLGGNQYLIPVDVDLRSRSDIRKLINIQSLLNQMAKSNTAVVLLDGCAKTGFARGWGDSFDRTAVCADEASQLTIGPGITLSVSRSTASTPFLGGLSGGLNIYTEAFVSSVNQKNTVADILSIVHAKVEKKSGGAEESLFLGNRKQNSRFIAIDSNKPAQSAQLRLSSNSSADTQTVSPGIYRLENLRVNRSLVVRGGALTLNRSSNSSDVSHWLLEPDSGSTFSLRNRNTGQYVVTNRTISQAMLAENLEDGSGLWEISAVEFGSPGELNIEIAEKGVFLAARDKTLELRSGGASSASGWIFHRLGDLSDVKNVSNPNIILPQTESSPIALSANSPIGSQEKLSEATLPESSAVLELTGMLVGIARSKFQRLKLNIQNKQISEVESMMHPGHSLDAFVHLMLGYSDLSLELGEVSAVEGSGIIYADLVVRAVQLESFSMNSSRELRKARLVLQVTEQASWSPIFARHCGTYCNSASLIMAHALRK